MRLAPDYDLLQAAKAIGRQYTNTPSKLIHVTLKVIRTAINCMKTSRGKPNLTVNATIWQLSPGSVNTVGVMRNTDISFRPAMDLHCRLKIHTSLAAHLPKAVKDAMYIEEMTKYIIRNTKWEHLFTFDLVHWSGAHGARKRIRHWQKLTIFKVEFNLFATTSCRHLFNSNTKYNCPRCTNEEERFSPVIHFVACRLDTLQWWSNTKQAIKAKRTCPFLINIATGHRNLHVDL